MSRDNEKRNGNRMKHPLERIAIVNRGEAALRLIRAVRELNREKHVSLSTVAFFTEPERQSLFVREADEAFCIGPATFIDQQDGQLKSSYQHHACIEEALLTAQASAVWPGWGMQASESWLAALCERLGITFVGPDANILRLLSDRISARQLALQANIPVMPVSDGGIEPTRHLEVQVIADLYGTTWAIDVRNCTISPRGQRVLEESSSHMLPSEKEHELREMAIRMCQLLGYRNVGSVRFIYDPVQHTFWFMEFDPCLSGAHPVTEVTTGLDLVKLQLGVACGEHLEGKPPPSTGHAFAAHLYAETLGNLAASPAGKLELFHLASGPGLRLDTGYEYQDLVQAEFDPVLATLTAWGQSRQESLARLSRALTECAVIIREGMSNKAFLLDLLYRSEVGAGQADTYQLSDLNAKEEDHLYRRLHPMMGERHHIWRLSNFQIERLPSAEDVYLFHGIAHTNPKDERLFALAEVRDMTPLRDESGKIIQIPQLERMLMESLEGIRLYQSHLPTHKRLPWNRVLLYVWPPLHLQSEEFLELMRKLWPDTEELGLERIAIHAKIPEPGSGELRSRMLHISNPGGRELVIRESEPIETPIATLSEYRQKVVQLHQRGLVYPYEIIEMLTPAPEGISTRIPPGTFTEYDLNEDNHLLPVDRPYGKNKAGIVVGTIRNHTSKYPEGMTRVILLGDPSQSLGSVAEPECRRIIEALNLAEQLQVPLEWFAFSAGARISMESGTENMDWVARTLRRIIEFTQKGFEINVVVNGINVGAQPYWNAEATMLMHTRGILIMPPNGAMVLTGKQSLDYSGGVSAEDNYGIGGYEPIMGPNGQAQYFALDLSAACHILLRHYDHTYVLVGERFPRRSNTTDPATRDVRDSPYFSTRPEESDLTCLGDLFSAENNAARKHPFDIRTVMWALIDADHQPLERWHDMHAAETVVVWDAHIGGFPVALLGIESRPLPRRGFVPSDGPEQWTAGALFPLSAKKAARAINSASGNRPLVVIANLSGFDGSPESLRTLELEYGAEIGRAITNFKGPIVFCVVSRYHGGSFVVFSKALNENIEVAAVKGSYASVIGGIAAAAVVFAREVDTRTKSDPRMKEMQKQLVQADRTQQAALQVKLNEISATVRSEKVGEVASEFDHIHNVQRAQRVGSIDHVIEPEAIRPYLIEALQRGIDRELQRITK